MRVSEWHLSPTTELSPALRGFDEVFRFLSAAPGRQRYEGFLKSEDPHNDAAILRLIAPELYTDSAAAFRNDDTHRRIFGDRFAKNAIEQVKKNDTGPK